MTTTLEAEKGEVIETDDQTAEHEEDIFPEDIKRFELNMRETVFSVYDIARQYQNGKIILDAPFQRNMVWRKPQMSKFIESILLDIPVPALFFNQTIDNELIVIDGRQRVSTLISFLGKMKEGDNFEYPNFKLTGLKKLKRLEGMDYKALDTKETNGLQARIEDKQIPVFIIKPSTRPAIVYDIFERLNTTGTPLNKQEVRNALFRGKSIQILKDLAENEFFLLATNKGISDKRLKAQETVLRVLCFMLFDYEKDYTGNISDFLENGMKHLNTKATEEEIETLKNNFNRIMKWSYEIFGKEAFRLPTQNNKKTPINLAILDSVCYFLHTTEDTFLQANKITIQTNFDALCKKLAYIDAIGLATSDKEKVKKRFNLTKEFLSIC